MFVGVDNKNYIKDAKNVTFRSSGQPIQYAIMRVDRKFYNLESIEGFEYHMERKGQVENADAKKSHENRILIGDANVYNNLDQHIKGVWMRKDSCIARDMILSASPSFFKGLSKPDFERWLTLNVEWLQNTYGPNVIYCVLHNDETTSHLHVLLSVDYVNDKGKRVMSNKHFFDGKKMLSELQTNYATYMQSTFKTLSRGLKGSKDTHISIKQYYNLCAKKLDEKDLESVMAKAKNNELTEIKLNNTKKTLNAYKNYQVA
ncbi:MAG: MobV family relaxase, partial [Clostridia bacterium]